VRDAAGELQPKLVELQAFPSLYAYQPVLAQAYIDVFGLDPKLRYYLNGLDSASYRRLLRDAIVAGTRSRQCHLDGSSPRRTEDASGFSDDGKSSSEFAQSASPGFAKQGPPPFYEEAGKQVPIERIYNRAIVDELERKGIDLPFDFRDDLDVEWGRPSQLVFSE
jgi:hypothetical protein